MFASFHSKGTIPSCSDMLNTCASGILIFSTISFSVLGDIPSTPGDLFSFILLISLATTSGVTGGARWPSGLERWTGDRTVRGSNPTAENFSLRNFGNSVYPALPVSFGGDTKRRRSLLSGVYARGSKRPHQSALERVTVVDSTAHSKLPQKCVYAAENAALH